MFSELINRSFMHKNFTIRKVISFGVVSLFGAGIVTGGTWILTEFFNIYYVWSTIITGAIAFGFKFLLTAIWTFNDK